MSVVAAIALSFLSQVCKVPDVIDVFAAERFGEEEVIITLPTDAEREKAMPLLAQVQHIYNLHVMTPPERQATIQAEIKRQRASNRQNFGNCWPAES